MPKLDDSIEVDDDFRTDPASWLAARAREGMTLLLAHADDGVIWGEVRDGRLVLAGEAFAQVEVELRATTLQQARLFGPEGELRVWRTGDGTFTACLLTESELPKNPIVEKQWLWGTPDEKSSEREGFTLLREGKQGMLHAPPIAGLRATDRVAVQVQYYIETDHKGVATIGVSRLAGLSIVEDQNGR